MSNTKPKPRPSARQIQKALDEDIDFYLALKAMPLEKLGPLAHHLEVLTPLFEAMLSAREELAHAEAAVAAGKKAKHEALMELVNARIAASWSAVTRGRATISRTCVSRSLATRRAAIGRESYHRSDRLRTARRLWT